MEVVHGNLSGMEELSPSDPGGGDEGRMVRVHDDDELGDDDNQEDPSTPKASIRIINEDLPRSLHAVTV